MNSTRSKSARFARAYVRGAFHSFEKAYEIFPAQKDFYGFLMDFSGKQKDFCQRRTRFFGVKCPSLTYLYYLFKASADVKYSNR